MHSNRVSALLALFVTRFANKIITQMIECSVSFHCTSKEIESKDAYFLSITLSIIVWNTCEMTCKQIVDSARVVILE